MNMYGTEAGFCAQTAIIWQQVGYLMILVKIIMPIILIALGIVTLGKAVISTDDKDIKKGINSLIKKFILIAVIFFLPIIITTMFGIVSGFSELKNDYNVCNKCITHPKSDFCNRKVAALDSID